MTSIPRRRLSLRVPLPRSLVEPAQSDVLPRIAPWVVLVAAAIPVLLTAAWSVADVLQPRSYSPMRQTVSVLSGYAGTDRWIVTGALYVVGVAYLLTAVGMSGLAAAARVVLLVAGAAAIGIAAFPEPVQGTNRDHAICTAIGAIAIAAWPAIAARQESVLAAVGRRKTFAAIAVSLGLLVWTAAETRNGAQLGLAERLSSDLQVCWPFVVALMLRRGQPHGSGQDEVDGQDGQVGGHELDR